MPTVRLGRAAGRPSRRHHATAEGLVSPSTGAARATRGREAPAWQRAWWTSGRSDEAWTKKFEEGAVHRGAWEEG